MSQTKPIAHFPDSAPAHDAAAQLTGAGVASFMEAVRGSGGTMLSVYDADHLFAVALLRGTRAAAYLIPG